MKWTIWILLISLVYSKNIETDAEAVLSNVLREIRSKIIDSNNETNTNEIFNSTVSTTSLPTKQPTKSTKPKISFGKKSDDQLNGKSVAVDYTKSISTRQQNEVTTISPSTDNSNEKHTMKLEKKTLLLSDEIESLAQKTNGDHLVANILVEPEMPSRGKFEFVPHFDHNTFDFMIPAGQNAKQSLVAVIPFYGILDQKPPKFTVKDDVESWFSIGQVNETEEDNYILYQIPILLNPNVRVSLSSGVNGVYSAAIEARQDGIKTETTMKVEVLPMVDDSGEAESPDGDLIVSKLELTTDATNETTGIEKRIEEIFEKDVHEVVVDRVDGINITKSMDSTTETIVTTKSPVNFPEIQIETRGAVNKVLLVSEKLRRGNKVPEFEIRPSVGVLFDKIIEIDVQPNSIFVPRPRFVLPGESSRLVVVDSAALDFESGPKNFDITISAKFMENSNESAQTTKLTIQKYDEADIEPKHILAENNSTLQYTLLGSGSANFRIINGSLILSCQRDFESACLNREITSEYRLLAVAVDEHGLSSDAVPVTVSIVDVNDNGPILELFDNDLTIRNGEITAPFLFSVNDADEEENRNNTVELSNEASQFLSAEQISNQMYRLHVSQSVTAGTYFLDIAAKDQKGENLSQKARVKVTVMDTAQKARFQRSRYDRTIGADKLQKGNSLVQLQLDGVAADMIRFVILDGNPGYLTVEKFSGNVYIGELPSNGVPSGYYVVKVGAVDRETGKILATCEIFLSVHGNQLDQTTIFGDSLANVFTDRDNITDDLILQPTVNINENFTVSSAKAWDDEMVEMNIEENAIKTENGELLIASDFLHKIRSLRIKLVATNNPQDHAFVQYILTSDPKKLEDDVEKLAIPQFVAAPWRNETLEIRITEELPIGTPVVCLPAYNPVDGNRIFNLQLGGMGIEFFEVETKTGCIKIKRRIDYETLDSQTFHLTLTAKRGQKSTVENLQIEVLDVDDNAPELKQLGPEIIELAENSKPGVVVVEFIATDRDLVSRRHPIRYKLSGFGADNFRIHKKNETFLTISVAVGAELDHESSEELLLKLTVADGAENLSELPFRIGIRDVNDNRPQFVSKSREVDVFDNWATGIPVTMFEATDLDSGENGRCTFDLDETAKKHFQIDSNSGVVTVAQSLNGMASLDAYRFTVFANDHGDPSLSSTAELVVRIHEAATTSDVDEQELRILSPPIDFVLNLTEGTTAGQLVYRIDAQLGMMMSESVDGLVRYSLEPITVEDEGWLMIDENSGEVYLLRTLDYELQPFITKLADDAPLLFDPRRSGRQTKKPTDGFESPVPPWGDRFKQFRRSLKGRSLSSSKRISPKPPSSPPLNSKEEKPLKTNYSAYSEGDGLVFHGSPRISKRRSKSTSRTVEATPVTAILSSSNESTDTVIEKTHPLTLHGEIAVRAAAEGAKRQSRRDSTAKPPRPETESPYLSQIAVKTKEENTTQSPKINQLTAAAKRRQFFRRSRSVATQSSMDSRRSNSGATSTADFTPLPPPLVTHFPVDDSAPITEPQNGQFDAYGGFIPSTNNWQTESRPATQSAGESGYISGLELSIPRSASVWSPQTSPGAVDLQSSAAEMSPETRASSGIGSLFRRHARSPSFGPTSSAAQRHRSTSGARGTIFERGPGSPRLGEKAVGAQSVMLRNRRLPAAKSESNLRRYAQSNNISWALDALRERVEETKYVTAVFESAKDGIAPILPDILKELKHWLGPSSRLLAVACEVHYSVPENVRSRAVEIRMKDELHRVLRQNNRRVLQLYDEQPGSFPLELIESKTEENCSRDSTLDAFQGIYRRYYPELLELQDATTVSSHKSYWTLDTLANDQRALLRPTPARFLFRPNRAVLAKKSVVALNMAVLRMCGDTSDYESGTKAVNAVVRSSLSQQRRSARLLRIEVQNVDDNPPQFAAYSPLSQLVFTTNESSGNVGQIRAIDLDPEPFDQIFYYLLPSCNGEARKLFSINQTDGTIHWLRSEDDEVLETTRLCALASPRKLTETKVKELQFDRQNRSMIEFYVQFETNRTEDRRLSTFKNNTVISFDSNVRRAVIPFNTYGNRPIETQKLGFELEAITFQPFLPHNQPADTLDLFAVPSNTPEVRVDSRIFKQPEGVYVLRIAAVDHSKEPKQKVGVLMSQVHYVRSDHKLRFVFEKPIDQIGLSLELFSRELETILTDLRKQTTTIVLSSPRAYDSVVEGRNKSEVCFYIVSHGKIWTVDETINRISTNINPERRLLQLYQQYRVVNIENCATSSTNRNSAFTSELMSRELFVWTIALLVGILILLSLIGYTCFVTRYNNQESLGIWDKPSPSSSHFVIGQPYVTTPHNSTIQRSRHSTQLRR